MQGPTRPSLAMPSASDPLVRGGAPLPPPLPVPLRLEGTRQGRGRVSSRAPELPALQPRVRWAVPRAGPLACVAAERVLSLPRSAGQALAAPPFSGRSGLLHRLPSAVCRAATRRRLSARGRAARTARAALAAPSPASPCSSHRQGFTRLASCLSVLLLLRSLAASQQARGAHRCPLSTGGSAAGEAGRA